MANYPNSLDNIFTLPTVAGTDDKAIAINALQSATLSIEKELGVTPKGIYSDVRTRLDILESRININTDGYYIPDGYVNSPLYLVNSFYPLTVTISTGDGYPTENRLDGSLYLRRDGYVNEGLYARRGGVWKEITTDPWVASGDLTGTYLTQTVVGIRGKTLAPTLASVAATQDGYHLTWNNASNEWEAQTGFIAASDLTADSAYFGRIGQKVVRLQNRTLSPAAPTDTDSLVWDGYSSRWEPRVTAVIFDGYTSKLNLRSNRGLTQSPIDYTNTKYGIVNLSSRSSGLETGATADYSTIVGGDRHTVNASYGSILGGLRNLVSGQYGSVVAGNGNKAEQPYSFVGDGYSNTSSAFSSLVLCGGINDAYAVFSSVLNGSLNSVNSTSSYSAVGFGLDNDISGTSLYSVILNGNSNDIISGSNVFIGASSGANVQSNYSMVGTGASNTIGTSSNFSTIIGGQTNAISNSSGWSFIGNGNNITATGLYATVLNSTVATANGLHSLILNGNTNSVTGSYSTIGNGNNNTISGSVSYATILDGYSNTVSSNGGLIVDGYSNIVSGIWSSVLNGNNNQILGRNSTILNGSSNIMDANSVENTVIIGNSNQHINTNNTIIIGSGNTLTNVSSHFILGSNNNQQSTFSFTNGSLNTSASGSSFNRIFGSSNIIGANTTINAIFGNSNNLGTVTPTNNNFVVGASNTVDGYQSHVFGERNVITSTGHYSLSTGRYARARISGQRAHAVVNFNGTNAGEAQYSRVLLSGSGLAGTAFPCVTNDGYLTFENGKAYDITVRVLLVNNQPTLVDPTRPARFVYDLLASQEAGILTIHDQNDTLINQNGTGWTVTIGTSGNQLLVNVNQATFPSSPIPFNSSNRRAVVTVEWRELTRA